MAQKRKPSATKARSMALHIGLNAVDPEHYGGWSGDLAACEFDAKDMAAIARSRGMKSTTLLTPAATRGRTLGALRAAAKALGAGDLFFLTYSGHGGQVDDVTGEEPDRKDETWCLFDGELLDDELYFELSRFREGVRVLVLSDSCHSGTVTRDRQPPVPPGTRSKLMPPAVALRTYRQHRAFYDKLQKDVARKVRKADRDDPDSMLARLDVDRRPAGVVKHFRPAVLLISGCQDEQTSLDGDRNGAFTGRLRAVWKDGRFEGSYKALHEAIKKGLRGQTPNLFVLGPGKELAAQQAFSV
jgi:metacaspase-1